MKRNKIEKEKVEEEKKNPLSRCHSSLLELDSRQHVPSSVTAEADGNLHLLRELRMCRNPFLAA